MAMRPALPRTNYCHFNSKTNNECIQLFPGPSAFMDRFTVEIFLMHELIMHKSDNASIFAVTELVPI